MADKRTGPGEPGRRGKRAAPTIDLTATDVSPPTNEAAAEPAPPSEQEAAPPRGEPPSTPPSPESPQQPPASGPGVPPPFESPAAEAHKVRLFSASTLPAGTAGALLTAVLLFAMWLTGLVPIRYAGSTATRARVTALEMQMHDLQNRPAPAVDSTAIDALGQRVAKIEQTLSKLPPGDATLNDRLAAAENAMKALGVALTALNRRSDDVAATAAQARERAEAAEKSVADLRSSVQDAAKTAGTSASAAEIDALQKRLASLEQSAKEVRDDIAKTERADKTTRLALAAAALRDAVESGAPYAAQLRQAQALSGHDKALAPLEAFAESGLPSAQALAQDLRALLPALNSIWQAQPSGNFFDRLQANASKLVRVRPVDAPPGDEPAAVLARLEVEAAKADIPAALSDLSKLSNSKLTDQERSPMQQWIGKAKARQAAVVAARQFAADSTRSLGAR